MNKKKIMSIGALAGVLIVGVGCTYYIDPEAINTILGITPASIDVTSMSDLPGPEDASSSLPTVISDTPDAAPEAGAKKTSQKGTSQENNAGKSGGVSSDIDDSQVSTKISSAQNVAQASGVSSADVPNIFLPSENATLSSPSSSCSFPETVSSTTQKIILNEVAWMGTPSSSSAEWMELKNISASAIDLSGWELSNASEKIKIIFSSGDAVPAGGFFLLSRGSASSAGGTVPSAIKIYSGDLVNAGDTIALTDPQCDVSDYLNASAGWPGGNNTTKQTLERDVNDGGWHSSTSPGGTPGMENSAGPPPAQHKLTVILDGTVGGATIASDPVGLACGTSCVGSYASGTRITLTPSPGANAAFSGWSGLCYGETACSFAIATSTSLTASFRSTLVAQGEGSGPDPNSSLDTDASDTTSADIDISSPSTTVVTSPGTSLTASGTGIGMGHVLIATVQIGGASSTNDLVSLYNPTAASVDMSGWKLHKRSQTGTDYSLKVFSTGSVIAPEQSFVWANSIGGFSEVVGANTSSTETLSADNSVALMDATGNIIDAVAWGTGTAQYGEGSPYPTSPGTGQSLVRRSSGGLMADTENNINDFTLQ